MTKHRSHILWMVALTAWLLVWSMSACSAPSPAVSTPTIEHDHAVADDHQDHIEEETEVMPALAPVQLPAGDKLRVVATTNLIADVLAQVGGDHIELTSLMPPGIDPHSYQATPSDLRALSAAHAVFVNGLGLEEALLPALGALDGNAPLIPVNAGVAAIDFAGEKEGAHAEEEDHHHGGVDPHTWWNIANVIKWTENIEHALGALDPANAAAYRTAAASYRQTLEALDQEVRAALVDVPTANRKLVTDHSTMGYFAATYGFDTIGSVIPSFSTMASPSAQELAMLQDQIAETGVKAIFVGSTVNPNLEAQMAKDTGVALVPLFTDSLSTADGPAATYVDFMRHNVEAIVAALK